MRWLVLAAAAISLSGCGLPTIVSVWSTALDFASYGASGKTVTDHGISLVLQKDCSLMRGLDGPVCTEKGAPKATRKPPRDDDTPASQRVVYLQEEANRGTARYPVEPDDSGLLRSALGGPTPAPIRIADRLARAEGQGGVPAYLRLVDP